MRYHKYYNFHFLGIDIECNESSTVQDVQEMFPFFKELENPTNELKISVKEDSEEELSESSLTKNIKPVFKGTVNPGIPIEYYTVEGNYFIKIHPRTLIKINRSSNSVEVLLGREIPYVPVHRLASFVLSLILNECLRNYNCYLIHSASVVRNGHAVLIPASTHKGKTTLTLSLLRSGYKYQSDDMSILQAETNSLKILSYPKIINLREGSLQFFPEMASWSDYLYKDTRSRRKVRFSFQQVYPFEVADESLPKIIIFPDISNKKEHTLEHIDMAEALTMLMQQSLYVTDHVQSKNHFEALTRLVETTVQYRLHMGTDLENIHEIVSDLTDKTINPVT